MGKRLLAPHIDTEPGRIVIKKQRTLMGKQVKQSHLTSHKSEIKMGDGLIFLSIFNVILIVVITFLPSGLLRMMLVVPYLLFFPGYTLLAAIFTRKTEINGYERLVLSVGLSFVVAVLVGLFLNYTMFGIRLEPVMYFLFGFILLTSAIAWFRRLRLESSERFEIVLNFSWLNPGKSTGGRMLSLLLVIGIIGALSYLGYIASIPRVGETFSEFYILGQPGKSAGYVQNMTVGEESNVYVGIVNQESKEVLYSIKVLIDNNEIASPSPVFLESGQQWEGEVSFTATSPGENQKFEFLLYRDNETTVYKSLHLWIDVTE